MNEVSWQLQLFAAAWGFASAVLVRKYRNDWVGFMICANIALIGTLIAAFLDQNW